MAAVLPGDESPSPGHSSGADRNGLGVVRCFVCGSGVTAGKELRLRVTYQEKGPFFPFLQNQEPAPGACELDPDGGHVQACAVCHCFLAEQWSSFERSRTPVEKRMYWLKRPYQCDSRRAPQEWNTSYDLERRTSVGSHNYEGAESDFSSFSDNDNMSDQELDLVERVVSKDKSSKTSGKTPKDTCKKNHNATISVKSSPDSQRASRCSGGVFGSLQPGSPRADSEVPPPKRGAKIMNHVVAQSNESSPAKSRERGQRPSQRGYDGGSLPDTPVRNRQWLAEGNPRHVEQRQIQGDVYSTPPSRHPSLHQHHHGRGGEEPPDALRSPVHFKHDMFITQRNTQRGFQNSDHSDQDDLNITRDENDREEYDSKAGPAAHLRLARDLSARKSSLARTHRHPQGRTSGAPLQGGVNVEDHVCFICGSGLRRDWHFSVSVQKQEERAQDEPFFPFLWLHSPPPGAVAVGPAGTTLVCGSCHSSLMQQWQGFQLADVPVLQRLYVVPLNQGSSGGAAAAAHHPPPPPLPPPPPPLHLHPADGGPPAPESQGGARECCFLCGQECGRELRVAYAQAGVGKSRAAMYFPFINMLPCPPKAQGLRNDRVHCCPPCHGILEDIWAAYRLSLSEDLITSVSSFLIRYHAALGEGPAGLALQPRYPASVSSGSAVAGSASVCYLCGAELRPGGDFQLHVNPPGRCGEKEPFFPFLTVHPPAPRAKPVDATGLVTACSLCYHDLCAQWGRHEGQGAPGSSTPSTSCGGGGGRATPQPASSPWARQYSCEGFACFFCRQEHPRQGGLCAVTVARLPVFLYAPRGRRTLLVDDGRRLVIGSCVECKALVQVGHGLQTEGRRTDRDGGRPTAEDSKRTEATPPRSRQKVGRVPSQSWCDAEL